MANNKKNNIKKVEYSDDTEVSKLIKLVVIVTLIVLFFYGITMLVNKEKQKDSDTTATIQYDEILVGNILKQPNDEYYVMIYDNDDSNTSLYKTYINLYMQKDEAIRVYTSQLSNVFNQKFKSEKSNLKVDDILDLKIKSSTLLKIKNKKIISSYEGDKLVNFLEKISKNEETDD